MLHCPVVPVSIHRCFDRNSNTLWLREDSDVFQEIRDVNNSVAYYLRFPRVIIWKLPSESSSLELSVP